MQSVILDMAISLDGFIAGLNDADIGLHQWFFAPSSQTDANRQMIDESLQTTGAIISGRNAYNLGEQYDGFAENPYTAANLVVTHQVPAKPARGAENFIFVTDGIDSALRQARHAAGDKHVVIGGGANLAQQFLRAGLVDEIHLHLIPVLAGSGMRLFEDVPALNLERVRVVDAPGATHLKFRVIR